jgi:spore maturation protein CgeB
LESPAAFKEMKTLVVYFNLDGFAIQLKNHIEDALTDLQIEWKECYYQDMEKASNEFQPTMTIFFHPNKEIYNYVDVIKELKGHKLLWDMESPFESDLVFDVAPLFYYIFTSDENTAGELKKEFPNQSIHYVPHAYNPKVHKPMEVSFEYRSDILFVGNAYESRLKWFADHVQEYKDQMVTIIGVGYRGLDGYQNQRVIHGHISEPEMVKYINGAKLVLNLHRQNSDLDMANKRKLEASSFNNRYYEVKGCMRDQHVIGRGQFHELGRDPNENNTYKDRLVKFYLPLLK